MSKKNMTAADKAVEEAHRHIDRIIAELDKELNACTTQETTVRA